MVSMHRVRIKGQRSCGRLTKRQRELRRKEEKLVGGWSVYIGHIGRCQDIWFWPLVARLGLGEEEVRTLGFEIVPRILPRCPG